MVAVRHLPAGVRAVPPPGRRSETIVHADYDHRTGAGTLRVEASCDALVRLRVPELEIDCAAGETVQIPVEPWSAESPRLYDGILDSPAERIRLRIGFRTGSRSVRAS